MLQRIFVRATSTSKTAITTTSVGINQSSNKRQYHNNNNSHQQQNNGRKYAAGAGAAAGALGIATAIGYAMSNSNNVVHAQQSAMHEAEKEQIEKENWLRQFGTMPKIYDFFATYHFDVRISYSSN